MFFLAPAEIFVETHAFFGTKYLLAPNDFYHFGTCLKASQLLAPEFQPLRLALYTWQQPILLFTPRSVDL